jgi:hypothetical protein
VYDQYAGYVYLYVNGALSTSAAVPATSLDYSLMDITSIGSYALSATEQMYGGIDSLKVLPYAVSAGFVTALYNSTEEWPSLPVVKITGDSVDGFAYCVGNTTRGSIIPLFRSGVRHTNNVVVNFELEEV